jgi:hypothetical protein
MSSAFILLNPTLARVPIIILTILYRNPLPVIDNLYKLSLTSIISAFNIAVACFCAFVAGACAAQKNYTLMCIDLALSLLNLAVAFW